MNILATAHEAADTAAAHGLTMSTEWLIIGSNILLVLVTGLLILVTVKQEHEHSEHEAKITADVTDNIVNAFVKLAQGKIDAANRRADDAEEDDAEHLGHA